MKKRASMSEILSKINLYKKKIVTFSIQNEPNRVNRMITIKAKNSDMINNTPEDDIIGNIESTYKGLFDIMDNYKKLLMIKNGVNSTVKIKIADTELTLAEAIALNSSTIKEYYLLILQKLKRDYEETIKMVRDYNDSKFSEEKINAYLNVAMGGASVEDTKKSNPDKIKELIDTYHEINDLVVVDPIDILSKIKNLDEYVTDFYDNINFNLAMINARIIVEYDLDKPDADWKIINLDEISDLNRIELED